MFFLFHPLCGQDSFYIVKDKDEFVNVRDHEKQVIDQLPVESIVWLYNDAYWGRGWMYVAYQKSNEYEYGYIHESRLKDITSFDKIPLFKKTDSEILFSNEKRDIAIRMKIGDFPKNEARYNLFYEDDGSVLVNGKKAWGLNGDTPKKKYKAIEFVRGKRIIDFPLNAYEDLFEPNFDNMNVFYDKETDSMYVVAFSSDGAEGYNVIWIIKQGEYINRFVLIGF